MKEILQSLISWEEKGLQAALVTVLQTWGSSPRQAGAHMAVNDKSEFSGSVSGGCVESAVILEALEVIQSKKSRRISYGVSDDIAINVGLACGGEIEIFITPIRWPDIRPILTAIKEGEPSWYQIDLDEQGVIRPYLGDTVPPQTPHLDKISSPLKVILHSPSDSEVIIVGGVNISQHLIDFSKLLGYKTTIVDPRKAFANPQRFPHADRILNLWPEEAFNKIGISASTAIVILTHDDKIDLPAIKLAVESQAFYVGALGSKKTQARRKNTLQKLGVPSEKLSRIYGPIGIDLGAKNPLEIALAIMAEITSVANKTRL